MKIDQLIRSKRRTIALIVERDGRLVVRAPLRMPEAKILEVVRQKAEWVRKKQAEMAQNGVDGQPRRYADGEEFWFLGKSYPLQVVEGARQPLSLNGRFQLDRKVLPQAEKAFQAWYREQARQILDERVRVLAARHGLRYRAVKITSARTRWGSCSAQGTLCFTWRLVMAPPEAVDYVVIHELAHLVVHNHSRAFWAKVQQMMPGYEEWREWLRRNGGKINA